MLRTLNIENIAIIEKASVDFSRGLNILTGETGAGKSILIDSINAVTGEKTSRELIRTGENTASVSALFEDISEEVRIKLSDNGLPCEEDGTLLLQRRIFRDGKNVCKVNGASVTVSLLRNIGMSIINIHGQRDSQALLDSEKHIGFLDSFAYCENDIDDYRASFNELCRIKEEIKAVNLDEAYKERQTDVLSYQINEIENADIKVGEKAQLTKKKNVLNNSKKLSDALRSALTALCGDGESFGADGLISSAITQVLSVSSLAKGLDTLSNELSDINSRVDDCVKLLDDVLRQLDDIDGNIDEIEQRLDLIYRLSKKYGETEEDILSFLQNAKKELDSIESSTERLNSLNSLYSDTLSQCKRKAEKLSVKRKAAAEKLSSAIQHELAFLDMPNCRFITNISESDMSENGIDAVEFLISANPGEEPKPLNKVASGGELSRIMLAIKNVLSKDYGADTLIFDEIDAGVSGSAARKIAVKLSQVSKKSQVLCITHLAQIAAFADTHKFLYKEVSDAKTYTRIKELSENERPYELARMTYGNAAEDIHVKSAEQMICSAKQEK